MKKRDNERRYKHLAEKDYLTPNYNFEDHKKVIEKLKEKLATK